MKFKTILQSALLLIYLFAIDSDTCYSQWVQRNITGANEILSFASNTNSIFAGTSGQGLFISTNNGIDWSSLNSGLTNLNVFSILIQDSLSMYLGTYGGVFKSTNNGINWVTYSNGITDLNVRVVKVLNSIMYAATYGGVFKSTNNGLNWSSSSSGISNIHIWCITSLGSNVFCGTEGGGIFKSTNSGTNWVSSNTGLTNYDVRDIYSDGTNLYAGTYGGVFISTNSGQNWTAINGGLTLSAYRIIKSNQNLFAATTTGIFLSTNNGTNWILKNQGFTTVPLVNLVYIKDNLIFAGTSGQSVWSRLYSEIININKISEIIPSEYNLLQNYPNPFNPSTKIKFDIARKEQVIISVFDISGRKITDLANENLSPGTYEVTFNGENLSSGIYYYTITAGNYRETKKMTLIK